MVGSFWLAVYTLFAVYTFRSVYLSQCILYYTSAIYTSVIYTSVIYTSVNIRSFYFFLTNLSKAGTISLQLEASTWSLHRQCLPFIVLKMAQSICFISFSIYSACNYKFEVAFLFENVLEITLLNY